MICEFDLVGPTGQSLIFQIVNLKVFVEPLEFASEMVDHELDYDQRLDLSQASIVPLGRSRFHDLWLSVIRPLKGSVR